MAGRARCLRQDWGNLRNGRAVAGDLALGGRPGGGPEGRPVSGHTAPDSGQLAETAGPSRRWPACWTGDVAPGSLPLPSAAARAMPALHPTRARLWLGSNRRVQVERFDGEGVVAGRPVNPGTVAAHLMMFSALTAGSATVGSEKADFGSACAVNTLLAQTPTVATRTMSRRTVSIGGPRYGLSNSPDYCIKIGPFG